MPDDSSEARNATVFATSSRRVTRPRANLSSQRASSGLAGSKAFRPCDKHAVGPDPLSSELGGQPPGQGHGAGICYGVAHLAITASLSHRAEKDHQTMKHLYASGDYHWSLFLGHLVIEKLLKGLLVAHQAEGVNIPRSHDLLLLA